MTMMPTTLRKETITSERVPKPLANYCQAVRAGQFLFLAGQLASDYQTGIPAEARRNPEFPSYGSDIELQTRYILRNIGEVLEAGGSSFDQVVKAQVFLQDRRDFDGFDRVWKEFFGDNPPPRTTIQMGRPALLVPGALVEIDLIGLVKDSGVKKEVIRSSDLVMPLVNYVPVVRAGQFVFAAGQVASDFKTGVAAAAKVPEAFPYYGSSIERQTRYTLENLKRTFAAAGSSLDNVVKAQVFLTSLALFDEFDDVWNEYFPSPPPRTTVQCGAILNPDCLLEIDLIGIVPGNGVQREVIRAEGCPAPLANYAQAIKAGPYVFLAGQLASDFQHGVAPEARVDPNFKWYGSDIRKQTEYILRNCEKVLTAAGSSLDQVVKAQAFHTNLDNFYQFDRVWKRFFPAPPPRTTIQTDGDGLLVPGALVEIDLIGLAPGG
ncbi:MAG: RidA family protein [Chloroflexi bacterium]|nr:RidA family protein [Chloroflexota bacterium]